MVNKIDTTIRWTSDTKKLTTGDHKDWDVLRVELDCQGKKMMLDRDNRELKISPGLLAKINRIVHVILARGADHSEVKELDITLLSKKYPGECEGYDFVLINKKGGFIQAELKRKYNKRARGGDQPSSSSPESSKRTKPEPVPSPTVQAPAPAAPPSGVPLGTPEDAANWSAFIEAKLTKVKREYRNPIFLREISAFIELCGKVSVCNAFKMLEQLIKEGPNQGQGMLEAFSELLSGNYLTELQAAQDRYSSQMAELSIVPGARRWRIEPRTPNPIADHPFLSYHEVWGKDIKAHRSSSKNIDAKLEELRQVGYFTENMSPKEIEVAYEQLLEEKLVKQMKIFEQAQQSTKDFWSCVSASTPLKGLGAKSLAVNASDILKWSLHFKRKVGGLKPAFRTPDLLMLFLPFFSLCKRISLGTAEKMMKHLVMEDPGTNMKVPNRGQEILKGYQSLLQKLEESVSPQSPTSIPTINPSEVTQLWNPRRLRIDQRAPDPFADYHSFQSEHEVWEKNIKARSPSETLERKLLKLRELGWIFSEGAYPDKIIEALYNNFLDSMLIERFGRVKESMEAFWNVAPAPEAPAAPAPAAPAPATTTRRPPDHPLRRPMGGES